MAVSEPSVGGNNAITPTVYLDGEFMPPTKATISPLDRGFIFGDGIYEVVPVFNGRPFRLVHHLRRLRHSLAAVGIDSPIGDTDWHRILQRLVDDNGAGDQYLYLQITRGIAPRDHVFPVDTKPTVFAYAQPTVYAEPTATVEGVSTITTEDIRWQRCDIKSTSLLAAVMLRQQAAEKGSVETLLVRNGLITEGAASNVFMVVASNLITPPTGAYILAGITRELILELAKRHNIPATERDIEEKELAAASEIWIASSTQEIKPVTTVDGSPVGAGTPGPVFTRLLALYQEYKRAFCEGRVD
ncbi:MAG: D-amino acid aminotransferase [Gammaproteobacteria bacterium]|jgi:D-alanine transaminase|nr:D-amino acid aminotransferase [Gammaproteobacteria bacterium]